MSINRDSNLALSEAIALFFDFLIGVRRASPYTIGAYRTDLGQFSTWIQSQYGTTTVTGITAAMMTEYVVHLQTQEYSSATQARKVASGKALFKFCRAMEYSPLNPSDHIARPRVSTTLPKVLSVESMEALIDATTQTKSPYGTRDRAMLETIYATGLRVSELLSLNIGDIDFESQLLRCYGKGNKERIVPVHQQAIRYLQDYIRFARPKLGPSDYQTAVFLNRFGKRLSRQGFWLLVKDYAKISNVGVGLSPHTLRHSFATHMIEGGAPISYVQVMLGHASVSTTEVYNHVASEYLREEFESAHPRASHTAVPFK